MIEMSDKLPLIECPVAYAAACERAVKPFKTDGMWQAAKFAATVHERAIDYIEQAPALVLFVLPEDRKRKLAGGDRTYAAHRLAHHCRQGVRLKDIMKSYGLTMPLRKLKGKALAPEDINVVRLLATLPPSVVSQAIPNSIADQRRWLSAVGEWRRICGQSRWADTYTEWAVAQLAKHKVRKSDVGTITDFIGRGDLHMPDAPGLKNRKVDEFAAGLYVKTPKEWADKLGIAGADLRAWKLPWEKSTPALHEIFRARAIRMLSGDLSVMPMAHEMRPL